MSGATMGVSHELHHTMSVLEGCEARGDGLHLVLGLGHVLLYVCTALWYTRSGLSRRVGYTMS